MVEEKASSLITKVGNRQVFMWDKYANLEMAHRRHQCQHKGQAVIMSQNLSFMLIL